MGRPRKKSSELLVDLSAKVSPYFLSEVELLAASQERPRGWVARKLLLRGLAAYRRDGLFDEPEIIFTKPKREPILTPEEIAAGWRDIRDDPDSAGLLDAEEVILTRIPRKSRTTKE